MPDETAVVIGAGGMGRAIARRIGSGRTVILADHNETALHESAETLAAEGHRVVARQVDVSSAASVSALAQHAADWGNIGHLAHTAGLSPSQASTEKILDVDLLGVALVLEEFAKVIAPGGAGVVIASMAGHMFPPLTNDQEHALGHTPSPELLRLPFLRAPQLADPGLAYGISKQANLVRVRAASALWGRRGARINAISPGIIATPMSQTELDSELGEGMRAMIASSPVGRIGTPEDIASAAAFLLGPDAAFITGTDLLVDGGVTAVVRTSIGV